MIYRIFAVVLIGIGLFVGGYFKGQSDESNADDAQKGKDLAVAVEKHDEAAVVGRAVERQSAVQAAKTEEVFNGIQQGVITYAQTHPAADCSLDADGLRLWRAANAGADADGTGGGHGGMPAAAATGERQPDGPADEPRGGSQAVPPVPGPAQGPDRLAGEN